MAARRQTTRASWLGGRAGGEVFVDREGRGKTPTSDELRMSSEHEEEEEGMLNVDTDQSGEERKGGGGETSGSESMVQPEE